MRNHTSAHLLQAALRAVLGDHVHQAGSYVDASRVRFDFSHFEAMKPEEITRVEELVNEKILEAINVSKKSMPIGEAKKLGAMALFGEKYGDVVRVIEVPGFSVEFCGGTHVDNTSTLGLFKILSESSVAAGVRRIEGTTGEGVLEYIREQDALINETAGIFKLTNVSEMPLKARATVASAKEFEREIEQLTAKLATASIDDIVKGMCDVNGISVFSAVLEGASSDTLRTVAETIKDKYPASVTVLGTAGDGKVTLCAACGSKAIETGLKAGAVVKEAAAVVGGSGGGKPDLAMAGGKDASKLSAAVESAKDIIKKMLG